MSWVAVGTVAVSAISAGVSANSANKKSKAARSGYNDVVEYARDHPEAFGEKLDWRGVDYQPLYNKDSGYSDAAASTIAGNQRNLSAAQNLASNTNDFISQDAMRRINTLDPTFQDAYTQQAQNTLSLLRGNIPQEDLNAITSRRTEAQSLGGGGFNPQQVAADIGQTRLGLMQQGAANLTSNANLWNLLSPRSSYVLPQSMFVDTNQAVNSAIQENQFASQFGQAERNAALQWGLQGDPQVAGIMNLLAGRAGIQASNPTQNAAAAAFAGGAQGYAGYLAAGGAAKPADSNAWQGASAYVPPAQYSSSKSDFANGIPSLSNTGAYSDPYAGRAISGNNQSFTAPFTGAAVNPYTGGVYGEQGSLGSYFPQQQPKRSGY